MDNQENKNNIENSLPKPAAEADAVSSIANAEARDEEAEKVEGKKQDSANFTEMFGIKSEEKPETKAVIDIPIRLEKKEVVEVKQELTPEEKKKNHQKNFNDEEKLIYKIEAEKDVKPMVVFFFFLSFTVFVLALPYISKKIDLSGFFPSGGNTSGTTEEEDSFHDLNTPAERAKIGQLEFINFTQSEKDGEYYFAFTIQNVGDRLYNYDKKYYVVLYDQEKIIYYALIHDYIALPPNSAAQVKLVSTARAFRDATRFKIEEIEEARYPEVNLVNMEGEYKILNCRHLNDEMKYYFKEDKLVKITETYAEDEDSNVLYHDHYMREKARYNEYLEKEDFETIFVQTNTGFKFVNNLNLEEISDNTLAEYKVYRFFRYNVPKNTVAFELQAQGYTCQ